MSQAKQWPRFMRRVNEDGVAVEKQFASPEAVPAGEGWDFITPPIEGPATDASAAGAIAERDHVIRELSKALEAKGKLEAVLVDRLSGAVAFAKVVSEMADAPADIKAAADKVVADNAEIPTFEAAPEKGGKGKGKGAGK